MTKKLDSVQLAALWDKFDRGDHLTTAEIKALIKVTEDGLCYLRSRREHLAMTKTIMDLNRLVEYLVARKDR